MDLHFHSICRIGAPRTPFLHILNIQNTGWVIRRPRISLYLRWCMTYSLLHILYKSPPPSQFFKAALLFSYIFVSAHHPLPHLGDFLSTLFALPQVDTPTVISWNFLPSLCIQYTFFQLRPFLLLRCNYRPRLLRKYLSPFPPFAYWSSPTLSPNHMCQPSVHPTFTADYTAAHYWPLPDLNLAICHFKSLTKCGFSKHFFTLPSGHTSSRAWELKAGLP